MANLKLDFADKNQRNSFPNHGWAVNSQGAKLLWFPILRLTDPTGMRRCLATNLEHSHTRGECSEIWTFQETVQRLVFALRELNRCARVSARFAEPENNEELNLGHDASFLLPLYLDLAYVYMRRLADQLTKASRFVLFNRFGSAPWKFKELRKTVACEEKLRRLHPICDVEKLQEAVKEGSGWFDQLAREGSMKGIRDMLEHRGVSIQVSHAKPANGPWRTHATFGRTGTHLPPQPELLSTLKEIVAGFCAFCTLICSSVKWDHCYKDWVVPYGDAIVLFGNEDDSVAFWPEL